MHDDRRFSPVTSALHTKINNAEVKPVVTPIYQNSAFHSDSPYFYTRKNNPNNEELEQVIAAYEEAGYALSVTTGMAAVSLILSLFRPGSTIVLNKDIYGCTFKYFQRIAARMNHQLVPLDLSLASEIKKIPPQTDLVFFETPTNPFLKTVVIKEVSVQAKKGNPNALIAVDNTWATPLFQKPLLHGADISLYSATKYFSGHSDVMGGIIVIDKKEIADRLREERFYSGAILDPHSAWLIRRSMQTFALRMKEHQLMTIELTDFVKKFPQVKKVYYPVIDGIQLCGYGGIIFFELIDELVSYYTDFAQELELFDTGTGMACVTSMVAQPFTGSHASMSDDEKKQMGLDKNLVRLCFGFEDIADLKKDISDAFHSIENKRGSV